jgi:fatty acid desaturase
LGVLGAAILLIAGGSLLFLIPILVVMLLVLLGGPVLRFVAERGAPGTDEPGVPSTREAAYEAVEPRHPSEQ